VPTPEYRLGIDVGGTNTDAVIAGPAGTAEPCDPGQVAAAAGGRPGGRGKHLRRLLTVRQDHASALGRSVSLSSYPVRSPESCVCITK
jgi:N-methylhydantoinase A/oxoprolinase/acetone carboxylase beta subunit